MIAFFPVSLFETAYIELEDVHWLVENGTHIGKSSVEISVDELLDIGASTGPDLQNCAEPRGSVENHLENHLVSEH